MSNNTNNVNTNDVKTMPSRSVSFDDPLYNQIVAIVEKHYDGDFSKFIKDASTFFLSKKYPEVIE